MRRDHFALPLAPAVSSKGRTQLDDWHLSVRELSAVTLARASPDPPFLNRFLSRVGGHQWSCRQGGKRERPR